MRSVQGVVGFSTAPPRSGCGAHDRSFEAKGGLERELSKRNQMNAKLERALGTAKDELDTLQLQLRDKKQMQQSKEGEELVQKYNFLEALFR